MKKYLSIYTLLALACIVLQSCLFSEEEIFDESSANRATADVIKCQEILKDVPNGWKLEYYIGSNYSAGAITLLMMTGRKLLVIGYLSNDARQILRIKTCTYIGILLRIVKIINDL